MSPTPLDQILADMEKYRGTLRPSGRTPFDDGWMAAIAHVRNALAAAQQATRRQQAEEVRRIAREGTTGAIYDPNDAERAVLEAAAAALEAQEGA